MKKNITIFIADDDEDDKQLFIESVKEIDKDITCVTASDGQEAFKDASHQWEKMFGRN